MERRLAAILAADIAGFSRLVSVDEEATLARLHQLHVELIDPSLAKHGGRIANTAGDSILAEFPSAVEAARFARGIQSALAACNKDLPEDNQIRFRIGLNLGDVVAHGDDLLGDGVNVAARLEALAPPGGIIISRSVRDQIRDKLDVALADLGMVEVKNIARPVRAFQLLRAGETPVRLPGKSRRSRAPLITAAIFGLGGLLLSALWIWHGGNDGKDDLPLPDRPSVAVLPFTNMSDDKAQDYFSDGLTDDLITDLSKVSGLFVISRNTVFTFKDRAVEVRQLAQDLGVRYVVEGSVRRADDQLRVNAQLTDALSGHHVWAERYNRKNTDIFAVQDELVGHIVAALSVELTRSEQAKITEAPETSLEAYDYFLQAREGYFSRDMELMRESLNLYSKSWSADPDFARAYAGYARLAVEIWRLSAIRGLSSTQMRRAAEVAARKAMAINPRLADTHAVLALLSMVNSSHDQAMALARQAVELEPSSVEAHSTLALVLFYAGRHQEALGEIRTAIRLDPKPTTTLQIYFGLILFMNGEYADAIAALEPIKDTLDRGLGDSPREILAMAYAESGDIKRAKAVVAEMRDVEIFLNVEYFRVIYSHTMQREDVDRRIAALKKASMPVWPMGYIVEGRERLPAEELRALINRRTWTGSDLGRRSRFIQEFGADGTAVYAGDRTLLNGLAYVKGDQLCEVYDGFVLGRVLCGPVIRVPGGSADGQNELAYVNPATVREFTAADLQ
jgi:adenylate cyclase